jgi:hypothetical protein
MHGDGERARLQSCLVRLTPHLRLDDVALTGGGVAVELQLAAGRPPERARVSDLDLVARRMDAVAPTLARDFLVGATPSRSPRCAASRRRPSPRS